MKISQTNIHATKIIMHNNELKGQKYTIKHQFLKIIQKKYKLQPNFFKTIERLEEGKYKLSLAVEIISTEDSPFPLDIDIEFATIYTFKDYESVDELENYLNLGAIQMIFPYMRTAITSIVSAALLPPLVLPIIDVRQFKNRI